MLCAVHNDKRPRVVCACACVHIVLLHPVLDVFSVCSLCLIPTHTTRHTCLCSCVCVEFVFNIKFARAKLKLVAPHIANSRHKHHGSVVAGRRCYSKRTLLARVHLHAQGRHTAASSRLCAVSERDRETRNTFTYSRRLHTTHIYPPRSWCAAWQPASAHKLLPRTVLIERHGVAVALDCVLCV